MTMLYGARGAARVGVEVACGYPALVAPGLDVGRGVLGEAAAGGLVT